MTTDTTDALAGRVLIAGFDGEAVPEDLAAAAASGRLGGLVIFSRNVRDPAQVSDMIAAVVSRCPGDRRPLIAVDQEGGRVVRLRAPLTALPSARALGEADDPELTGRAGRLVALELGSLGFTVNLAPVLDIDTNPASPVIGDRSYGGDAGKVVRHAFAFARGLRDGGVHPCAKHFPGHGDATVDSHLSLPVVGHPRARLERTEMEPFAAWTRTGLGSVMIAHVLYPALDPDSPATTSRAIVTGELRDRLGFGGAILSDDLEMGAVSRVGGPAATAVKAIDAGVDGLLVCRSAEIRGAVLEALAREARDRPGFARRLELAATRLAPLGRPARQVPGGGWIGSGAHLGMRDAVLRDLRGRG